MEPWTSWALTLVAAAGLYYYYSVSSRKTSFRVARSSSFSQESPTRTTRKRDEPKPKRKPDAFSNKKKEPAAATKIPNTVSQQAIEEDQDQDKQWAHQLAGLQKGTSLTPPERKNVRSKTVKQRTADVDRSFTSGSSNNGADADAEPSPAQSPALNAAAAGGVADMLEAVVPGPSVLRLTEPTNPVIQKKTQKKASPEPKETKKQRQNRKKVEQEKAFREEAEAARRILLEKQRRTAREARGEPAKNGVGAAPSSNAWPAKKETTSNGDAPLLDTFEPKAVNPSAPTGTSWERDLPSEEEQMRMAMADSGWNTVEKGKKGKKKAANTEPEAVAAKEMAEVQSLPLTDTSNTSRSNTMSTDNEAMPNGFAASAVNIDNTRGDIGSHPDDSPWAVVEI